MPTTTEPPWLNKSSGVTTPNGTATTTISFGFTPTSGSLVVVLCAGSVTNAATGWTKRAGPVSSAELTLFDKTAAGETSIAVTHNGSNYAVAYTVFEFPAGSAHVTNTSGSVSGADTFPALALSGAPQVVLAALGRGIDSTAGTYTSVWASPWVEDAEHLSLKAAVGSPTGIYMTVAHQINITATTITPSLTSTDGLDQANGVPAPDRQRIVAAYDTVAPPAPATPADVERVANASAMRTVRSLGGMLRA